jgi:hypothetical protein
MRKGLFAAALIPLSLLIGAGGAQAATTSQTVIVSPGSRVCTVPMYGRFSVRAQGQASPGVSFTLHQSADGSSYQTINQTPSNYTTAWAAQFANTTSPQYFPGWFKACARNYNTTGSTVTLSVSTDS